MRMLKAIIERYFRLVAEILIDLETRNILRLVVGIDLRVVVEVAGSFGQGYQCLNFRGGGVDSVGWNNIARKRSGDNVAVHRIPGQRVVDGVFENRRARNVGS